MPTLVGEDRLALVDRLVAEFDAVVAGGGPRAISLESPLGLGKTRLVQDLFGRLATGRQPKGDYWPSSLQWRESAGTGARPDLLQARKQVEPTPGWVVRGNLEIPWLWWGISCHLTAAGSPMRAMKDASDQLQAHLDPLTAALQRGDRRREDAVEAMKAVFDLVGVVNPGSALDAGSKFLGIWRRRREEQRRAAAIAVDRRVETSGESFADATRIAESLAAVARSGTPVVLAVDDAHWADAGLVSLLRHLIELEQVPVLIVTTAWPEKLMDQGATAGTFAGWIHETDQALHRRIDRIVLDPLPQAALADLVLEVAPRTPAATADQIAEIAGGNPLVLNLLLDLDLVRRDIAADGRIDTSPADLRRLPSNLRAIYHDLWRQLPDGVQRVLALVAVQGPQFLPGFVVDAASRIGMHDELVPALEAARTTHHWLRAVTDDRWQFAEPQRFEVVEDLAHEVFTDATVDEIRAAIVDYIVGWKASVRWSDLDESTRRLALESHLELNEQLAERAVRDLEAVADSMMQLAAIEVRTDATDRAAALIKAALAIRDGADGQRLPESAELERAAEQLTAEAAPSASPTPSPAGGRAVPDTDEWGRRPWTSWSPRPITTLTELRPSELAELVAEVVAVEGPVFAGRVHDVLLAASGVTRKGRLLRGALDRGVQTAIRRGSIVGSIPDATGLSERRVLRLPDQPDVVLRELGPRTIHDVPSDEIAELGRRVLGREPALSRSALKTRVAALLGEPSDGRSVDRLLEAALPASFGDAAAQADDWGRLPWVGWRSHAYPALVDLKPLQLGDAIVDVVAAEGPVTAGRVFALVATATGAARQTAAVVKALDGGLAAGVRRGSLVAASGRRGDPDTRILRLPSQPEVVLRQPGDRDPRAIPHSEVAELARRVWARAPGASRDDVKRQVGRLIGATRLTAALDTLLEFALAENGVNASGVD